MSLTLTVPQNYGYTALTALGAIPLLSLFQGFLSTNLRRAAKVSYPNTYATANEAATDKSKYRFNCSQRAHANLLENMPQTIAMMLWSGLFYPRITPVLGGLWVLGRGLFAYGYVYSDKEDGKGRFIGSGFWLCQLGLLGLSVSAALKMI